MTSLTTTNLAADLRAMAERLDAEPEPLTIGGDMGILKAVRALGQIAPLLSGVYSVTLWEDEVRMQGRADEVAHFPNALGLTLDDGEGREDDRGNHYSTWSMTRPDGIKIMLVAVRKIQQQEVA